MPFAFDDRPSPSTAPAGARNPETLEAGGLTYRPFETPEDAAACAALQAEIWGAAFADQVPASLLRVATSIGGLAIGGDDGFSLFTIKGEEVQLAEVDRIGEGWWHVTLERPLMSGMYFLRAVEPDVRPITVKFVVL